MPQKKVNAKAKKQNKSESPFPEAEFYGTAQVGTKGQFVIPSEARKKYNIQPGDKIIVFGSKGGVLAIMKADQLSNLLDQLTKV